MTPSQGAVGTIVTSPTRLSAPRTGTLLGLAVVAILAACSTTKAPADGSTGRTSAATSTADLKPAAAGARCGAHVCPVGQTCCNPSCGICAPPDGFCTQQVCEEPGPPPSRNCASDADCRIISDYCTGCDCRVLTTAEKAPGCEGPGVRCVADPCRNKAAACQNGFCVARDVP